MFLEVMELLSVAIRFVSKYLLTVCQIILLQLKDLPLNLKMLVVLTLHCCKAHSKPIGKMENSTPCKIVTPENFILKLGIRDYVENITHYTNFHVHRFSGGFSTNR